MKLRLFVFPQNYILFILRTRPTLEGLIFIRFLNEDIARFPGKVSS